MTNLIAIILTRNEAHNVSDCIASLRGWCDAVIVWDSGSTDATQQLAYLAGAQVVERPFDNYAAQRQAALDTVKARWILFVDADERITPALRDEILAATSSVLIAESADSAESAERNAETNAESEAEGMTADDHSSSVVDRPAAAAPTTDDRSPASDHRPPATEIHGYWIARRNFIAGKETRWGGFYPDYQLRLLKREQVRYDPGRPVHEIVEVEGETGRLREPMIHYNYRSWGQFYAKQPGYALHEASILKQRGIKARPHNFVLQPLREFWRRFVTLQGFRDGFHGLKLALLIAWYYGFVPYWDLWRGKIDG